MLDCANVVGVNSSGCSLYSLLFIIFLISSTLFLPIDIEIMSCFFTFGIFKFSIPIIFSFGTLNILVTLLITFVS